MAVCHSKALSSQRMWILCSCVACWTQKSMSTQLKLSYSDLASHCVSVEPQELLLDLFLAKQDCWKCLQASSWGSAYFWSEMSSSSLITDPKAICIPVPQISLCQALQNWGSPLLKFVGGLCLCLGSETDTRASRHCLPVFDRGGCGREVTTQRQGQSLCVQVGTHTSPAFSCSPFHHRTGNSKVLWAWSHRLGGREEELVHAFFAREVEPWWSYHLTTVTAEACGAASQYFPIPGKWDQRRGIPSFCKQLSPWLSLHLVWHKGRNEWAGRSWCF